MNVTEFVNRYNSLKTDKDRESYLLSIKKRSYLPIISKVELCRDVFNNSLNRQSDIPFSIMQYIYFAMSIIDNYTTINVDYNNINSDYDKLREADLLQLVLSLISEDEITELNLVKDLSYGAVNGLENQAIC